MTLAVFRPTPGSFSTLRVRGSYRRACRPISAAATKFLALLRHSPCLDQFSHILSEACARAAGHQDTSKQAGVMSSPVRRCIGRDGCHQQLKGSLVLRAVFGLGTFLLDAARLLAQLASMRIRLLPPGNSLPVFLVSRGILILNGNSGPRTQRRQPGQSGVTCTNPSSSMIREWYGQRSCSSAG